MNDQDCAKLIAVCCAMYPTHPIPSMPALVSGWSMALAPLPYRGVESALRVHLRTSKWFPSTAELIEIAALETGFLPHEAEAWALVTEHMRRNPASAGTPFAGPPAVLEAVKQIGGWYQLRNSQRPEKDREAFVSAYAAIRKRWLGDPKLGSALAERLDALGGDESPQDGLRVLPGGREGAA